MDTEETVTEETETEETEVEGHFEFNEFPSEEQRRDELQKSLLAATLKLQETIEKMMVVLNHLVQKKAKSMSKAKKPVPSRKKKTGKPKAR